MGSNSLQTEGSYSEQYALFSGQYAHGNIEDIIESVYEKEMLEMSQKNTHMGMWQIWASTNVISRPIMSIFPDRGSPAFRSDFNTVMCLIPCPTEEERTHLHYVDPYSTPRTNPALCTSSEEIIHYLVRNVVGHLNLFCIELCFVIFSLVCWSSSQQIQQISTVLRQISIDRKK